MSRSITAPVAGVRVLRAMDRPDIGGLARLAKSLLEIARELDFLDAAGAADPGCSALLRPSGPASMHPYVKRIHTCAQYIKFFPKTLHIGLS